LIKLEATLIAFCFTSPDIIGPTTYFCITYPT